MKKAICTVWRVIAVLCYGVGQVCMLTYLADVSNMYFSDGAKATEIFEHFA